MSVTSYSFSGRSVDQLASASGWPSGRSQCLLLSRRLVQRRHLWRERSGTSVPIFPPAQSETYSSSTKSENCLSSWDLVLLGTIPLSMCVTYMSVRTVSSRHVGVFVALPSSSNWSTFTDSTGVSSAARLTASSWGGVADVSGSTESADTVCSSWCVWLHRVCCRRCWLAGWVTPEAVLAAAWSVDGGFGVLFACMLPLDRSCGWYLLRCVVILVTTWSLMVLLHVLQTATLSKIVPSCLRFLSPKWRQISALPFVFATTTKSSSMMTHCPLVVCKQQSRGMRYRV